MKSRLVEVFPLRPLDCLDRSCRGDKGAGGLEEAVSWRGSGLKRSGRDDVLRQAFCSVLDIMTAGVMLWQDRERVRVVFREKNVQLSWRWRRKMREFEGEM